MIRRKLYLPWEITGAIVVVVLAVLWKTLSGGGASILTSPSPVISPVPSASVAEESGLQCLADSDFLGELGQEYHLTHEAFSNDTQTLECVYKSTDLVNSVEPMISYKVMLNDQRDAWQTTYNRIHSKPSFKNIEGSSEIFAEVNPVVEVAQITLYAKKNSSFFSLTYSPVRQNQSELLAVGVRLIQRVVSNSAY